MLSLPPITLRLRGWKLIDRVALAFLLLCSIALGAGCGLLFVYASDLPEIRALETYRPDVVTEVYADDGQLAGSFALQRRILMTYEQCPKVLYSAVTAIEDQHFEEHWGIDFPRMFMAAVRNVVKGRITGGASTISMQLAGNLFLDRSDRSFRRKMQEILLALQIERRYTKPQIFTMYANQVYLAHGNYGFAAAAEFYFGKPVTDLKLQEAALLAGMVNGPKFSPLSNRDGVHSYDRRHGWRGDLPNILRDNLGTLAAYEDEDWRHPVEKGSFVTGLVLSVEEKNATIKIGPYRAILSPSDFSWTGRKKPADLLKVGDLAQFSIQDLRETTA